jgi:hypothetical protein
MCCGDTFDRDELGIDPEDEEDDYDVVCEVCLEPIEKCQCEEDEED